MKALNDLGTPSGQRAYKAHASPASQYAMRGYQLIKGDPAIESQAPYYAACNAVIRPLPDLDVAGECLARLVGPDHGKE